MRLYWKCGCGSYNYKWGDWIIHFKHGPSFWRAVRHLLMTRPHLQRFR